MSRRIKELVVSHMEHRYGDLDGLVLVDYGGLSAEESVRFRAQLRAAGVSINVVKNTLIRRVLEGRGVELQAAGLRGPTALVYGDEGVIAAAKAIAQWRKKNGKVLRLKAGLLDGKTLDERHAEGLTKIPSGAELHQILVSVVAGPLTGALGVLVNTLRGLPAVLQAIAEKRKQEEGE